jgi:uncharacterized membrane protein
VGLKSLKSLNLTNVYPNNNNKNKNNNNNNKKKKNNKVKSKPTLRASLAGKKKDFASVLQHFQSLSIYYIYIYIVYVVGISVNAWFFKTA